MLAIWIAMYCRPIYSDRSHSTKTGTLKYKTNANVSNIKNVAMLIFTRESSYCFQRVLAIAILSVRLSVCLSVRHTGGSGKNGPNLYHRLPGSL